MAVLDLSVTVADADYPRLIQAAKAAMIDRLPPNPTDAMVIEGIRQHGIQLMRSMVRNYEKGLAVAAAEALEPTIEVT